MIWRLIHEFSAPRVIKLLDRFNVLLKILVALGGVPFIFKLQIITIIKQDKILFQIVKNYLIDSLPTNLNLLIPISLNLAV